MIIFGRDFIRNGIDLADKEINFKEFGLERSISDGVIWRIFFKKKFISR